MRLYYNKFSRATRPRWLIEEAGIACEIITVDLQKGEQREPAFRALHPHGKVPVLVDGDVTMFESAAICLYLADKVPGFAPPVDSPLRGPYYQWCVYAAVTLEEPIARIFGEQRKAEGQRDEGAIKQARWQFGECAEVLSSALVGHDWLVGDRFTTADILVGSTLAWGSRMGLCADYPELLRYIAACSARPAFERARGA